MLRAHECGAGNTEDGAAEVSKALSFTTSDADEGRPQIGMGAARGYRAVVDLLLPAGNAVDAGENRHDKILLPEMVNNQTSELQPAEIGDQYQC